MGRSAGFGAGEREALLLPLPCVVSGVRQLDGKFGALIQSASEVNTRRQLVSAVHALVADEVYDNRFCTAGGRGEQRLRDGRGRRLRDDDDCIGRVILRQLFQAVPGGHRLNFCREIATAGPVGL